jgi:hypothetical protein
VRCFKLSANVAAPDLFPLFDQVHGAEAVRAITRIKKILQIGCDRGIDGRMRQAGQDAAVPRRTQVGPFCRKGSRLMP